MANSNMKVLIFAASLIAMAIIVSAHDGHDHADGPSSKMGKGGRDGPFRGDDRGVSSSLAPFSGLMVGLVGLVFSFARI
ncbi:putative KHDC1-like protein [Bienertia sinuspersici]